MYEPSSLVADVEEQKFFSGSVDFPKNSASYFTFFKISYSFLFFSPRSLLYAAPDSLCRPLISKGKIF